ncbi:MAG TPA: invasion associated locus B family protein [Patescibacteria group bacterium]|nr:invasion associated locus B family protein [Patescibacteria group bacterium]
MKTKFIIILAAICSLAGTASAATDPVTPGSSPAAAAKPAQRPKPQVTKFDDWSMQCLSSTKGKYCGLYQKANGTVDGKSIPAVVAEVEISKSKDGKKLPHLRLITPLGVWLPTNIGFKLDEEKQNVVPFFICGRTGCMTELTLEQQHVDKLKKGKKLVIGYKLNPKKQVESTLSLKGFAAALEALQKNG